MNNPQAAVQIESQSAAAAAAAAAAHSQTNQGSPSNDDINQPGHPSFRRYATPSLVLLPMRPLMDE